MIGGAIINTAIGAGIKLGAILINAWLESKKQTQMILAARDDQAFKALAANQANQAKDPFVKVTRRVLFLTITFTLCYMMIYYAMNPGIEYDVLVPIKNGSTGIISWILGTNEYEVVRLTGGLLLMSFMELAFMVMGFYAVPSPK